jgi:hypothetical protein
MKQTAEQLIRADKLETLAKLLAKSWFYGNWEWETPNERIMQMLMQDLGYYPFKNKDEMIQQTRVDEDLYKEAVDKVELRNPRLMPVENYDPWDEVIDQLVDTNEMIDHVGEVNEMVCMFEPRTDTSSATICKHCGKEKFLHNQVSDVGKYTEEQIKEAVSKSVFILLGQEINLAQLKELIIQSLKQLKQ